MYAGVGIEQKCAARLARYREEHGRRSPFWLLLPVASALALWTIMPVADARITLQRLHCHLQGPKTRPVYLSVIPRSRAQSLRALRSRLNFDKVVVIASIARSLMRGKPISD